MEPTLTTYAVDGVLEGAALHLVAHSTLAPYVLVTSREGLFGGRVTEFTLDPDAVPFKMWGSTTQLLWEFLGSLVTRKVQANLNELLSRADTRNTRVIFEALQILHQEVVR
jgi:hypothetical protein